MKLAVQAADSFRQVCLFISALLLYSGSINALNMVSPYSEKLYHTESIRAFLKQWEQRTGLEVTLHSGASLYKHGEIYRAVRTGQVELGELFIGILSNQHPLFQLDNLPFLATNFEQARLLWEVSRPKIDRQLAKEGLHLLYAVPWPPQGIYSQFAIHSIQDLAGSKMRVYNALTSDLAERLNTFPTSIQTPEIPQAFSTGMINAMITSPSTGVNSQAWEYVSHYTNIYSWIPKNMVVIQARFYNSLSVKQRAELELAASQAEQRGWQQAQIATEEAIQTLKVNGIQVMPASPQLLTEFKKVGEQILEDWLKRASTDDQKLIEAYQSRVNQAENRLTP